MQNPMLDVARVRLALRQLDVKPSRAMGQNFLVDANALAAAGATGLGADHSHCLAPVAPQASAGGCRLQEPVLSRCAGAASAAPRVDKMPAEAP